MNPQLIDAVLHLAGRPVLTHLPPEIAAVEDPSGTGVFLRTKPWIARDNLGPAGPVAVPNTCSHLQWPLGRPADCVRWLACARGEPYWMTPRIGRDPQQVPRETQCLLLERSDGQHLLIVPLLDEPLRFALQGGSGGLELIGETNDAFAPGAGGVGVFLALGTDPYELCARGAAAVAQRLPGCRLRRDKPLPDFIDLFGWCTWDAFYQEVDPAGIRAGLAAMRDAGVSPRLLIIDDGWLTCARQATGGHQLTALAPNGKFDGTFAPVTAMAKGEFGVTCVLAWHAMLGTWGGLSPSHLPAYGTREVVRSYGVGVLSHHGGANHQWWGPLVGLPAADRAASFYDDWHRLLASQGIDGVKVDVQATLESCATGSGGRVGLYRSFRTALESSVARHFNGRLINCMSHNSETWYLSPGSNLCRFSGDFYPTKPETHGPHLWTNAALGLWFGEFQHPDWDMFHSLHAQAGLHAAARAISGGPVYVSDKPGQHDAAVLRRLVLADGTVARCTGPACLSPASLYADPLAEAELLRIWNRNPCGAVVGAFNVHRDGPAIAGTVSAADVPGFAGEAVLHADGRLQRGGTLALTLDPLGHGIVTLAPLQDGLAVIGLERLYNPGAAVLRVARQDGVATVELRDGGTLLAWAERRPRQVRCGNADVPFTWDAASHALRLELPLGGPVSCAIAG